MITKSLLTILVVLMSVQMAFAQNIIYGEENKAKTELNTSENDQPVYYKVDQNNTTAFTSANNTLVVCRLVAAGSDSKVVCSTDKPEKGWGSMVSDEEGGEFSYNDELHDGGANIFSIVYTDPQNGWAVGELEDNASRSGVVFHTTDGGESWELQLKSGAGVELHSIGFNDSLNGWANGERIVGSRAFDIILTTTDGGETWKEQNLAQLSSSHQ